MIWGNESNNDYIAQIIKIEARRASELTIWAASGLAAGAPGGELPCGGHSQGGGTPSSSGTTLALPLARDLATSLMSSSSKQNQTEPLDDHIPTHSHVGTIPGRPSESGMTPGKGRPRVQEAWSAAGLVVRPSLRRDPLFSVPFPATPDSGQPSQRPAEDGSGGAF